MQRCWGVTEEKTFEHLTDGERKKERKMNNGRILIVINPLLKTVNMKKKKKRARTVDKES